MKILIVSTGEAKAKGLWYLLQSKQWTYIILDFAISFGTPDSVYEICLPSRSLILGEVIGSPFGDPNVFEGGGIAV